jgi:formylglycine-generating enzyme
MGLGYVQENEYQQFAGKTALNPTGPDTGFSRVLRGGSWYYFGEFCRSAYRWRGPVRRNYDCGFRVAQGQSSE